MFPVKMSGLDNLCLEKAHDFAAVTYGSPPESCREGSRLQSETQRGSL